MSYPAYNSSILTANLLAVATRLRRRREIISSTLRQIELLAAMKSQAQRAI